MTLLAHLTNVATATKLPEGDLTALKARMDKLTADMSDAEKAKLEKQVSDCFTSVSSLLDQIEMDRAQATVNRLRTNSATARRDPEANGFKLPKAG